MDGFHMSLHVADLGESLATKFTRKVFLLVAKISSDSWIIILVFILHMPPQKNAEPK